VSCVFETNVRCAIHTCHLESCPVCNWLSGLPIEVEGSSGSSNRREARQGYLSSRLELQSDCWPRPASCQRSVTPVIVNSDLPRRNLLLRSEQQGHSRAQQDGWHCQVSLRYECTYLRDDKQGDARGPGSYNDILSSKPFCSVLDGAKMAYSQSKVASAPGRPKLLEKSGPICQAAVRGMLRTKPKDNSAIFAVL
jgi:hypothetical protein